MSTTPRLSHSIPFWTLVGGSVVALAGGAFLLVSKLSAMDAGLTDQTATTSDVYVGQIWAVAGAIIAGAGLVGLALALTVAALSSLKSGVEVTAVDVYGPPAWDDEIEITADAPLEGSADLDANEPAVTDAQPAADAQPADAQPANDAAATPPPAR